MDHGERPIEAAIALTQRPEGIPLVDLAAAMGAPLTSAQRAVGSLVKHGLVDAPGPDRTIRLDAKHQAAAAFSEFALRRLSAARTLAIVCRANRAVEFGGEDDRGMVIVLSPFADPSDVARFEATVRRVNADRDDGVEVEITDRSDLRERLLDEPAVRTRGLALRVVKGSSVRTFPDPFAHGSPDAPHLGRLHPSLRASSAALARIARRHHLARLAAIGSAVHADFRPDSDVDILIEPAPGRRLGVGDIVDLTSELEALFERDVDIVRFGALDPSVRANVLREQVVLYGSA